MKTWVTRITVFFMGFGSFYLMSYPMVMRLSSLPFIGNWASNVFASSVLLFSLFCSVLTMIIIGGIA